MADYQKMYYILCAAADEAVTMLESIPGTETISARLVDALTRAEELYIRTFGDAEDEV